MKTLILYAHPALKSFNRQVLRKVEEELTGRNDSYVVRDLYEMGFNSVLTQDEIDGVKHKRVADDVKEEQRLISEAERIIMIFPLWWGGMPAILRGYIDRVFTYGFAYTYEEETSIGLLTDKKVVVFCSTGTSVEEMTSTGLITSICQVWEEGIFKFCGLQIDDISFLSAVPSADDEMRDAFFNRIEKVLA